MSKNDNHDNRQWLNIPSRHNTKLSEEEKFNNSQINSHSEPHNSDKPKDSDNNSQDNSHKAHEAANLARTKAENVYNTNPPHQEDNDEAQENAVSAENVYERTHSEGAAMAGYDWRAYHSAWQDYYQKYYQRYYMQYLQAERQRLAAQHAHASATNSADEAVSGDETQASGSAKSPSDEFRNELLNKVGSRAKKVSKSSHFLPIATALVVGILFLLINYNMLIAAEVNAYISPSNKVSDSVIVDPSADVPVGKEPRLIIPKINVDAPLVFGLPSLDNPTTQEYLKDGVVNYPIPGADSVPGQTGNSVFLGHSSHTVWDDGDYRFVFVLLPRMEVGDLYYINYEGTRYAYRITKKQVITPDEIEKLVLPTDKPMSTLVTCVPIGTNAKRLLLFAEQISPDPTEAEKVQSSGGTTESEVKIPGNSRTILQTIFGT